MFDPERYSRRDRLDAVMGNGVSPVPPKPASDFETAERAYFAAPSRETAAAYLAADQKRMKDAADRVQFPNASKCRSSGAHGSLPYLNRPAVCN